ncbi:MAG: hypothetical protein ABSF27_07060 [Candidatus Dormibacteria bacterium]
MSEPCPERRGELAMAAVGRLGGAERRALLDHSSSCPGCGAALSELQATARLLPLTNLAQLGERDRELVPSIGGRAGRGRSREGVRRVSWRWLVPTAAALALGVVATALALAPGKPLQETVSLRGPAGARATAVLTATSGGTEVDLSASGQPAGQVFTVTMESRSGTWWPAGSYRTTGGRAEVRLSCGAKTSGIDRIWVRNSGGRIVLQADIS